MAISIAKVNLSLVYYELTPKNISTLWRLGYIEFTRRNKLSPNIFLLARETLVFSAFLFGCLVI